jgi:hypothetical protein
VNNNLTESYNQKITRITIRSSRRTRFRRCIFDGVNEANNMQS